MRQRFLCSQKRTFSWIRQTTHNFTIDPNCKNRYFDKLAIFTRRVYGDFFLNFSQIQQKLRFWVHQILWHLSCKFQLEIDKKVIAQKRFTNLYKMSSRWIAWDNEVSNYPFQVECYLNQVSRNSLVYIKECRAMVTFIVSLKNWSFKTSRQCQNHDFQTCLYDYELILSSEWRNQRNHTSVIPAGNRLPSKTVWQGLYVPNCNGWNRSY